MTRSITINGAALTAEQLSALDRLEAETGDRWRDGAYWYDARSGAVGEWGGPATGWLDAGLPIAGPMPAGCSGGGTGVFVNGRELHLVDVIVLEHLLGTLPPARYWCDAQRNAGFEDGPAIVNMDQLSRQRRAGAEGCARSGMHGHGGFMTFSARGPMRTT